MPDAPLFLHLRLLQYLVDTAHGLGLLVIMDLVHSHACKNVADGGWQQQGGI